jgi:diguanylate cyclase (GGDEF)-like protein
MGQEQAFKPILRSYRGGAAILALVALATGLGGALALAGLARHYDQLISAGSVAGSVAVLTLLVLGHRRLRRQIAAATNATQQIMASAHRDALTGVFTRSFFLQTLREAVYHGSETCLGYMQLDMDNLKVLNDSAGHAAGDAALVHLTRTVAELIPTAVIGRLGGDEFGIAIFGHDNKPALRRLGEEILRRLDKPLLIGGRPVRLSATIGLALAPLDAVEVDELISKADLALYKGKKVGRHTVVPFDPDMLGDERHRRFVERELRAALLLDELEVHYQPVFGPDMAVRSHEALVRWRHKVRGMIPPAQFVPIAEESDLIVKLGEWVLRRVCLDLPLLGSETVAVNVSPAQLRHSDFAPRFSAILEEAGPDPRQIVVEITETVPLTAGAVETANLAALRALGVRIAIDDFGAGHASLQYLRGFAFDIIKIDRTYVANIGSNRIDAMIVGAICDIARSLPVMVIAEGVETEEQLRCLRAAGCTGFQGYLLGRPQPLPRPVVATAA